MQNKKQGEIQVSKSLIRKIMRFFVIGLLIILVISLLSLILSGNKAITVSSDVVRMEGNKQIIDLTASNAGYSPSSIEAQANKDTILRVKSTNLFSCASSIRIPELNISKNLEPTATTDIALGTQAPGSVLDGTCSMGMYNFKIKFV